MEYFIGLILSLAVGVSATVIGLDRERAFYPTVLIVIASYYVLFAACAHDIAERIPPPAGLLRDRETSHEDSAPKRSAPPIQPRQESRAAGNMRESKVRL